MSGRVVPRIALAGLLLATLAAPTTAQEGGFQVPLNADPVIPIPTRPEDPICPFRFGSSRSIGSEIPVPVPPEAPMPRAQASIPDLDQVLQDLARKQASGVWVGSSLPYLNRLFRNAEAARQKDEAAMPWVKPYNRYEFVNSTIDDAPPEVAPMPHAVAREVPRGMSCIGIGPPPLPLPSGPIERLMLPPEPPAAVPPLPCGEIVGFPGVFLTGSSALPLPHCEMGLLGGSRARDVTDIIRPAPIQLVGGISTCGTFQHATAPQPLQFLLAWHHEPNSVKLMRILSRLDPPYLSFTASQDAGMENELAAVNWELYGIEPATNTPAPPPEPVVAPVCAAPANPLLGTWYRDVGIGLLVATFTPDEMKLSLTENVEDNPYTLTITAHYTPTKDGLLYGAITGADLEAKAGLDKEDRDVLEVVQGLTDCPFSLRVKQTSAGMMVSNLKCSAVGPDDKEPSLKTFGGLYKFAKDGKVPVATRPKNSARAEHKNDGRVPILPPIRKGEPLPICEEAPSDAEVLRAIPPVPRGIPYAFETFRDHVVIVKNRLVDQIDPPRTFPLVGPAQLHHCHWECVVYFDELVQSDSPFPTYVKKVRTQVVYIDKDFLHMYVGPNPDAQGSATTPGTAPQTLHYGAMIGGLGGSSSGALPDKLGVGTGADSNALMPTPFQVLPPYTIPLPPTVPPTTPAAPTAPTCPMPKPIPAVGCGISNDSMKLMAGEAFGQLLQQGGAAQPNQRCPDAYPLWFPTYPALPLPCEAASADEPTGAPRCTGALLPSSPPAKPGIVGTWYRETGGKQSVVKIAPDHLTVTITESHELDDAKITLSTILTIDYQFMRDGTTALGLIANVDLKLDGDLTEEMTDEVKGQIVDLRRALEDKPFAMTVRLYGDTLVLGKVRLPALENADLDPAPYIGGRYTNAGDKPLPKPKAIKVPAPTPLPPADSLLPAPGVYGYPTTPGTATVPSGWAPASGILPVTVPQVPQPTERSGVQQENPPAMNEPVKPVPQMSQPAEPVGMKQKMDGGCGVMPLVAPQCPPGCTPMVVPCPVQPLVCAQGPVQTPIVVSGENPIPSQTAKPGIVGTWYREIGTTKYVIKIEAESLTITISLSGTDKESGKEVAGHFALSADYRLLRDGVTATGVITGVDAKLEGEWTDGERNDVIKMVKIFQDEMGEHLFGMTLRRNSETLVISNVRLPCDDFNKQEFAILGGHYTSTSTKVPKPKAIPENTTKAKPGTPTLPNAPAPCWSGSVAAPLIGEPRDEPAKPDVPKPDPHAKAPTGPLSSPKEEWVPPAQEAAKPVPQMPQPARPVLGCNGLIEEWAASNAVPAKPGIVGTWYREIGTKYRVIGTTKYVIKIEPETLTITLSSTEQDGSRTESPVWIKHLTLSADYHLSRDGTTIIGVVTGLDVRLEGAADQHVLSDRMKMVRELREKLLDWPFTMAMRVNSGTLVIGSVRMPGGTDPDAQPFVAVSGHYTTTPKAPKPKAIPENTTKAESGTPTVPNAPAPWSGFLSPLIGEPRDEPAKPIETKSSSHEKAPTVPFSSPKEEWVPPTKEPAEPARWVPAPLPQAPLPTGLTPPSSGADIYPMDSRTIKLPIEYKFWKDKKTIRNVLLYVARNRENTWYQEGVVTPDKDSFVYTAQEDGEYWFKLVIEYTNGVKDPPDLTRDPPDLKVVVDTAPPVIRVTNAKRSAEEVVIEWVVDDKYLNDARTKVEFCVTGEPTPQWRSVRRPRNIASNERFVGVTFRCGTADGITVRITASDIAGNSSQVTKDFPAVSENLSAKTTTSAKSDTVEEQTVKAAPPTKPGLVGTWYREIGPVMCVIKIEADHLTANMFVLDVVDDKEVKAGGIITADYHLARNGTTVVGLVTGFDWLIEGDVSNGTDVIEALTKASTDKIQKEFVDHPYAFNVRVYGDTLMISNVKAPMSGDDETTVALFAGRYKNAGDKPVPKPKAVKSRDDSFGGLTLPSARALDHYPQYFTPNPPSPGETPPSGASTAPTASPSTVKPGSGGEPVILPPPQPASEPTVPSMAEPTPPGDFVPAVPQMPQPTLPALRSEAAPLDDAAPEPRAAPPTRPQIDKRKPKG